LTVTKVGRSRLSPGSGYLGTIPDEAWEVLGRTWQAPFSLKSDYARKNTLMVAFLSSMGWITNITPDGTNILNSWHCTIEGLQALRNSSKIG
jgi:hypothetical protein